MVLPRSLPLVLLVASLAVFAPAWADGPARAALGIAIADGDGTGPVAGVTVAGLLPGGGAGDAGLAVGDILTAVNGESLAADSRAGANARLVRFMASVDPGEELTVKYLRDGRENTAKVEARPLPPPARRAWQPRHDHHPGPFRGLKLATLSEDLGRYFRAREGLLVLRAPASRDIPLRDGDVIVRIGDRTPRDPRHARDILASYAPGEAITLEILRDRRQQVLRFTVPGPADVLRTREEAPRD